MGHDPVILAHLRARQGEVSGLVGRLADLASEGGRDAATYGQLVRLEADLSARILALTPPPIPDPDLDPANLSARASLLDRIERGVADLAHEPEILEAMTAHVGRLSTVATSTG
jgi:hypothetical protein